MIERINDSNNYIKTYNNSQVARNNREEDIPPFLLDYDEKGVVWERGAASNPKLPKVQQESYNPSDEAKELLGSSESKDDKSGKNEKKENVLFFDRIKRFFKAVMNSVWYGPDEKEDATGTKAVTVGNVRDRVPKGKGQVARNTSLLTTYDKKGKIVSPNPKDASIILKGDNYIEM